MPRARDFHTVYAELLAASTLRGVRRAVEESLPASGATLAERKRLSTLANPRNASSSASMASLSDATPDALPALKTPAQMIAYLAAARRDAREQRGIAEEWPGADHAWALDAVRRLAQH